MSVAGVQWNFSIASKIALFTAVMGVVSWSSSPICAADPVSMPERQQQYTTDDGWLLSLNVTNEVIDHIDNIAGASNSWQARVSYRAEVKISGTGAAQIQDSMMETGYFVGCRTDSSSGVTVSGGVDLGAEENVYAGVGAQSTVGNPSFAGPHYKAGAGLGVSEKINGGIKVTLKPGGLAMVPFDRINLQDMSAVSRVRDANLEIDGCGGQVKIQSYATFNLRSDNGTDTQAMYGEPKDL